MLAQSITHKLSRLFELGPGQSLKIVRNKIQDKIFEICWRRKAVNRTANSHRPFPAFAYPRFPTWQATADTQVNEKNNIHLLAQANLYTQNIFDILGSGQQQFTHIPWHQDFRLKAQNPHTDYTFDSTSFYKDIPIITGQSAQLLKDIKIPWELSRCQHLLILGQAYELTHDELYAHTFENHITDWLTHNPYMLGANWICPMEVGIRATNWIWAYSYFQHTSSISPIFWQKFTSSLYDHMHYLENNWEIYDGKTSNHYLSDLIGYFYLCYFFQDMPNIKKKRDWCYQELLREFDKQIFDEGTCYENTTAYHGLVTEIFDHFVMLCEYFRLPLSPDFYAKHKRMHEFIAACMINDHEMIKIGDDDSGRLLLFNPRYPFNNFAGPSSSFTSFSTLREGDNEQCPSRNNIITEIPQTLIKVITVKQDAQPIEEKYFPPSLKEAGLSRVLAASAEASCEGWEGTSGNMKHYPNFGISIIKTNAWHISLRHHAYHKRQPSGHIHNDALSVTIAAHGIPLVIDPGSYVYTASKYWRNHFRSVNVHNTFFIADQEPVPFDERLFALNIPENKVEIANRPNILSAEHSLYNRVGLHAHRTVHAENDTTIITDWWSGNKKITWDMSTDWNFTLHPDITAKKENEDWHFYHQENLIASMHSEIPFTLHDTWVSLHYGSKVASSCLRAQAPLEINKKIETVWEVI